MRCKLVVALFGLGLLASCASTRNTVNSRPEIALRRGAVWTTYAFAPPRIFGATAELQLKGGKLTGFVGGRTINIKIATNAADGFTPAGPGNLAIAEHDGQIEAHGLWNGGPAHLVLGPTSLRASMIVAHGRTGAQELSCGYQLDRVDAKGALVGSSACAGLPEETRLEVTPLAREQLSAAELATLLMTILAAAPP